MNISVLAVLLISGAAASARDYTTYIGDAFSYHVTALTVDVAGNTYLTGGRAITALAPGASPLTDVFVTKLDPAGNIAMTLTLSGKSSDQANGIAVDSAGNIYIAGITSSLNFPLLHPLQSTAGIGDTGFISKFAPDGTLLSTYLGGQGGYSALNGIAVDTHGDLYVTGQTSAVDYPHTAGLPAGGVSQQFIGVSAAFFAKISSAGDKVLYAGGISNNVHACGGGSSCFVSPVLTSGSAIAVDAAGNAYIAANTQSGGLVGTSGALLQNGTGAFIFKVNAAGTSLGYLTFLGSANYSLGSFRDAGNTVNAIAADAAGNVYLAGATKDPNFPATVGAFQSSYSIPPSQISPSPAPDAFAAKLNTTGSAMLWATYLGGAAPDSSQSLAVDAMGDLWVSGTTSSSDFPNASGIPQGGEFLVEVNFAGSALASSARFPISSVAAGLAVDFNGSVHAAGGSGIVATITPPPNPSLPPAPRIYGVESAAGSALAGRVAPGEVIALYGLHLGIPTPAIGNFDAAGFLPKTLAGVVVTINEIPAPLLYVSDAQINAVVPVALLSPSVGQLKVVVNGVTFPAFRVVVDTAAPQIFRNLDGSAAAINSDGTLNSADHPAAPGSVVAIWATGTGATGIDGQKSGPAQSNCNMCAIQSGTNYLQMTYAGVAPGLVNGITQINFQIPAQPNTGTTPYFFLSVGAAVSDQTFVYVSR